MGRELIGVQRRRGEHQDEGGREMKSTYIDEGEKREEG